MSFKPLKSSNLPPLQYMYPIRGDKNKDWGLDEKGVIEEMMKGGTGEV